MCFHSLLFSSYPLVYFLAEAQITAQSFQDFTRKSVPPRACALQLIRKQILICTYPCHQLLGMPQRICLEKLQQAGHQSRLFHANILIISLFCISSTKFALGHVCMETLCTLPMERLSIFSQAAQQPLLGSRPCKNGFFSEPL